jgi:(p)ppGpp synthase/HD superfamily hydrolase
MDIATVLNAINAKVRSLNARDTDDGNALVSVSLEVKSLEELRGIMNRLAAVAGVSEVTRNGGR